MTEIWIKARYRDLDLPYEVTKEGQVRRIAGKDCAGRMRPATVLKQANVNGYRQVLLGVHRRKKQMGVHSIVAFTFLGDPPGEYGRGRYGVNHINGKKSDNRLENLEWATPRQNKAHASLHGLVVRGELTARGKLSASEVLEIRRRRQNGERQADLSREFKVSPAAISALIMRKWWRHI